LFIFTEKTMTDLTEAETILKMLETVDPADTAKLDEIDARVWCWVEGVTYDAVLPTNSFGGRWHHYHGGGRYGEKGVSYPSPQPGYNYTRSRDALKAIRSKGWVPRGDREGYEIAEFCYGWQFCLILLPDTPVGCRVNEKRVIGHGRTEELAELHAIIQAMEWERRSGSG
jgi:hypothetical protein